ncbi:MAG: holo-ACP synthase [Parcubacteria group bacterium]|nr:holo-ACP synthase [Parcubacteria group bacterium]
MLRINKTKIGYGIGVDLEAVARFRPLSLKANKRFLQRVYSKNERTYCFSRGGAAAESLAVRFAAKEAVVKALSTCLGRPINLLYSDIEIKRLGAGWPRVMIKNRRYRGVRVLVSLAHTKYFALAAALAESF